MGRRRIFGPGQGAALLALAVLAAGCAPGDGAPAGWREVTADDLGSETAQKFRQSERGTYLQVAGDFDGDGQADSARFLIRADNGEAGLFFFLANGRPILADTLPDITTMGILPAAAGEIVPGCVRGLDEDCARQTVTLPRDGVELFLTDSAVTTYYLDAGEIVPVMSWRGVR